jgi:acetylserotonin N-methyltransferase
MHGLGMISSEIIAEAFDLSRFHKFVDLGGASGHLALAIQARYPEMEIAVFDVPAIIEAIRGHADSRMKLFPGNFFTDSLPPADLYALGKVLHNTPGPESLQLLQRIHSALPESGGLLVVERLLDEERCGPLPVAMSSLNMLVASAGRERTFSEYRDLLAKAGFAAVECRKTGAPVDAILALKSAGLT